MVRESLSVTGEENEKTKKSGTAKKARRVKATEKGWNQILDKLAAVVAGLTQAK